LDLRGACQASRHRCAIGSGWRCRRFDWLLNKSYYLSDLSLDTLSSRDGVECIFAFFASRRKRW
jgi:hypothetical protein